MEERHGLAASVRDLHGDVLAANERMLQMCRDLGFDIAADPDDLSLRKVRLKLPALGDAKNAPGGRS